MTWTLAAFSDLHLSPGIANRCTASTADLGELFDDLDRRAHRVVVAGDVFDLDRPQRPGDWSTVLEGVRRRLGPLADRLEAYDWIHGNHDAQLSRRGVPAEREYQVDGLRILACHGHQWDMLVKQIPAAAPTANFVAGWLERSGFSSLAATMGQIPLIIDRLGRGRLRGGAGPDRLVQGGADLLADRQIDILISGHSHRLRLVATPHGLFVNTGSLCMGHIDRVVIDAAIPRVRAWRDDRIVQQATVSDGRWRVDGREPGQ